MTIRIIVFVALRMILFLTFFICGRFASKKKITGQYKYTYWSCVLPAIIVYTLVEGLRYGRGMDFFNYFTAYQNLNYVNTEKWGVTFKLIYKLMHFLDVPQTMIFCIFSFITIVVFTLFMKHFRLYSTFMFPLFLLATLVQSENIVRQYISMAFSMLSIMYCINKDLQKVLLSLLISFLFHKASLFIIPFIVFAYFWTNKNTFLSSLSRTKFFLCVLLSIYLLPLFDVFDIMNDTFLGFFFNMDILTDYQSYSNAEAFEREYILGYSLVTQIKEWLMWGFLIILGYNIKDKYTSIGLPVIFYCFFVGSVILHINSGTSLFRLNLYYTTSWFLMAAAVSYDFMKDWRNYNYLSRFLFYGFIIMMLQSYFPILVIPNALGCDFIWNINNK